MSDLIKIHSRNCPSSNEIVSAQLSLDGVSETKSSSTSLDVYTTSFNNCRIVYPIKILRPINKYPMKNEQYFGQVLNDLQSNEIILSDFIADNPKRSFARNALCHSARYACEYCTSHGISTANSSVTCPKKKLQTEIAKIQREIEAIKREPCGSQ